jgi:hypothetical protein
MWRGILLGTLCLIACPRPPAPPSQAPTATATETRGGGSALTSAPDAGAPDAGASVATRPPPAETNPPAGGPGDPKADDRCTRDEDCVVTQLAAEGCCPQCTPRALSTAALTRLKQSCALVPEDTCPMPPCMRPEGIPTPACVGGRCTVKTVPLD